MSFTSDLKKEILSHGVGRGKDALAQKRACISAFIRTSGEIGFLGGKPSFFLVSETESVAEFFTLAFSEALDTELSVTHATRDRMSGRDRLLLQCPQIATEKVLSELKLLKKTGGLREGIALSLVPDEERKIAYIQGAFLGGGSCTLPSEGAKTGYHLEVIFSERKTAVDFQKLLMEFEILSQRGERKDSHIIYVKNKEQISDFLAVIGAENALKKLSDVVQKRDEANRFNRAQNCMAGNADKTAIASVKQVVAIGKLKESGLLDELGEDLQTLAKMRLENPSASLQELADGLKISKSCLNHRMRRLMELSARTDGKKKETEEE